MPIEDFATGPYSGTYNAIALGLTEGGYTITHNQKAEEIAQSDLYGRTMLDYIWVGADVSCEFSLLAFTKGVAPLNPFTAALYRVWNAATPVGTLASNMAKAMVLTATANTPAAALGPATLTAGLSILAPNYSASHLYDSKLRKLPLRMQFLPYTSGGSLVFAVTT